MRNCRDIQPDLSAYLDGELKPARRAEIEVHVGACPDCQRKLAGLRTVVAGVAALPRLQPAPQFLAAVRRKIAEGREPAESVPWMEYFFQPFWVKVPMEAAALVLIALLTVTIVRPRGPARVAKVETEEVKIPMYAGREAPVSAPPTAPAAKSESANEIAGESRRRIPTFDGAAAESTMARAPAASSVEVAHGVAGVGRSILGGDVLVDAKNVDDVRSRAEQLVARWNGKVIPGPLANGATGQVFFVELPRQCVTVFKSELLRDGGTNAVALSDSIVGRGGELTGYVETNEANLLVNRLERGVALRPASSMTTVLEIRVVSPAR